MVPQVVSWCAGARTGRLEKLLTKARRQPGSLQFSDLHALLSLLGFELDRRKGSHCVYVHAKVDRPVVVQSHGGKAKPYQVRQILSLVEESKLLERHDG